MKLGIALTLVALGIFAAGCGDKSADSDASAKPSSSATARASSAATASAAAHATASAAATTTAVASASASAAAPAASVAKLDTAKIDAAGKGVAEKVGKAFTDGVKSDKFADGADLSDDMKKITDAQWKPVFEGAKAKYGDFKSMTFVDAWDDEKGGTQYRYAAVFSKAPKVELRVDLNGQKKATKVGIYDWNDASP